MDATITTIGDVFKQKVADVAEKTALEVYDAPTIWVDDNGKEHEDREYTHISSNSSMSNTWAGKPDDLFYIDKETFSSHDLIVFNGPIKQVGSHVKYCGRIFNSKATGEVYPFINKLSNLFKYAKNLEYVEDLFNNWITRKPLTLPENMFWNCPKLKNAESSFYGTNLRTVPARLFEKCPELSDLSHFFDGSNVTTIPEDLFKNNLKLRSVKYAFARTRVTKIPDALLEPFTNEKRTYIKINVYGFVDGCPLKYVPEWVNCNNDILLELRGNR